MKRNTHREIGKNRKIQKRRKEQIFRNGNRIRIKGREARKFLSGEALYICSDEVKEEKGEKYRLVTNMGNVTKWVNQKYIHLKRGK